jgi:Tfp pilus assembly protein PilZ
MKIIPLRFRNNADFWEHYREDLENGGLFCPTTTELSAGETVVVEVSVPVCPNKILLRGVVHSWRPALPRLRVRAGAVVEFEPEEKSKRDYILGALEGTREPGVRRKHDRLPVAVPVRYRLPDQTETLDSHLTEISIGGAMLGTPTPLPLGTEVILDITPPGGVGPISILGRAAYHLPDGGTGLRFMYRDSAGSRRLRELVKRLRKA